MGARLYEPVLGRFSSADPLFGELASPLTLNRFVYGMTNPLYLLGSDGPGCLSAGRVRR
jgi:RHS repeat-associated protein